MKNNNMRYIFLPVIVILICFTIKLGFNSSKNNDTEHFETHKTISITTSPNQKEVFKNNPVIVLPDEIKETNNNTNSEAQVEESKETHKEFVDGVPEIVDEINQDDVYYLACTIYHEGRGLSDEAQIAIASIVLNRVSDARYPNTIYGVLTQKGQYSFARNGSISGKPDSRAYANAEYVLKNGSQIPKNVLYQSMSAQGSGIWKVIDGEYFCYN